MTEKIFTAIDMIYVVLMVAGVAVATVVSMRYSMLKKTSARLKELEKSITDNRQMMSPEYSEKILNYIKMFTTQITILKYREYIDSHNIEKITEGNIKSLIDAISRNVYDSLNPNLIDYDRALFTKEFLESYIIQISINTVKDLLDKSVNELQ